MPEQSNKKSCPLTIHGLGPALDRQLVLFRRHQSVFAFAVEGVAHAVKRYEVGITKHHSWNKKVSIKHYT